MSARARWLGPGRALAGAALAAACAGHDPSLHTVRVSYESRSVAELAAEGLRVDWQAVSGKLRVGDVVPARGLPAVAAAPPAERERDSEPETLEVLEGESGRIATDVGARVATRVFTPYGVPEDPDLVEEPEEEPGFDVTPRVLPDGRVRLELVRADGRVGPVVAGPDAPRPPTTTVTLAPGAKVAVGTLARETTSGGGSLFSSIGSAPPREERVLVVEVEIEAE